jgi:selenocysteine lyase/cysteine desulfurase
MNRREFVQSGLAGTAVTLAASGASLSAPVAVSDTIRSQFPGVEDRVYLNAAARMPLGAFAERGLKNYIDSTQRIVASDELEDYVGTMWNEIRGLFGELIGAKEAEIGLVQCTKAGEQIVLDSVDAIKNGGNIVTNDLHFGGSLHNLLGLKKAGRDVRIVRARDWKIDLAEMAAAIDDQTALVTVALVSNINGHQEQIKALSDIAHRHGALLYADIIQAAGIVPFEVHKMGIDVAACSSYKWLYGTYGSGFLFVRQDLQGALIPDRLFPGHMSHNYTPWVDQSDPDLGDYEYHPPTDARRYQPGHPSYLGYCAVYEGLKFLKQIGVENALAHSAALNLRLKQGLDEDQYRCITPDPERSAIITFITQDPQAAKQKLNNAGISVSRSGSRIRVAPALFNNEADIDALIKALDA